MFVLVICGKDAIGISEVSCYSDILLLVHIFVCYRRYKYVSADTDDAGAPIGSPFVCSKYF